MAKSDSQMVLRPSDAGMTRSHIESVARQCQRDNVFLFVRPSTDDTRRLIDAGFATKSMDIHDKSSDWGPMAGLVTVDPEFSKRPPGKKPMTAPHTVSPHNRAYPTQLQLTDAMLGSMQTRKLSRVDSPGYTVYMPRKSGDMPTLRFTPFNTYGSYKTLPSDHTKVSDGAIRVFQARSSPTGFGRSVLFVMVKARGGWRVYWVLSGPRQQFSGKMTPLVVWAYERGGVLNPVTGDYDLWMVAPHLSRTPIELHHAVSIKPDAHGESAVSGYTALLLRRLNKACGRSTNPVFNHGAESQNVGFTQAHDEKLVMFTPSGRARMAPISLMPRVLADLHKTGYIISLNKQWANSNIALGGKTLVQREQALKNAQSQKKDRDTIKALLADVEKTRSTVKDMKSWYTDLADMLSKHADRKLLALQAADLPSGYMIASAKMNQAAFEVQETLRGMVRDDLSGKKVGAVSSQTWFDWQNKNRGLLQSLRDYWGLEG